jgi:hypothetical protein
VARILSSCGSAVPAEELDDFNDHIVGKITVIAEHRAHAGDTTVGRDCEL